MRLATINKNKSITFFDIADQIKNLCWTYFFCKGVPNVVFFHYNTYIRTLCILPVNILPKTALPKMLAQNMWKKLFDPFFTKFLEFVLIGVHYCRTNKSQFASVFDSAATTHQSSKCSPYFYSISQIKNRLKSTINVTFWIFRLGKIMVVAGYKDPHFLPIFCG